MRCAKGDIAVIIKVLSPELERNLGGFVRCVELAGSNVYGPRWEVVTMQEFVIEGKVIPPGTLAHANDAFLQPIRPPKPPIAIPTPPATIEA